MTKMETAELLVRLCLPTGDISARLPDSLVSVSSGEWRRVCTLAANTGVASVLAFNLREMSLWELLPADQRELLERHAAAVMQRNVAVLAPWGEIVRRTEALGYRMVLAKESALAATTYPDSSLRYMGDIDVLVASAIKQPAEQFVRDELGYRALLDFHDRMRSSEWVIQRHGEAMLSRAVRATLAGTHSWVLSPEDNVIWLCWHDLNHRWGKLPRLLDFLWTVAVHSGSLDWDAVVERASAWGVAGALAPPCHVARHLLGDVVPPDVIPKVLPPGLSQQALDRLIAVDLWSLPLVGGRRTEQWSQILRLHLLGLDAPILGCGLTQGVRRGLGHLQLAFRRAGPPP